MYEWLKNKAGNIANKWEINTNFKHFNEFSSDYQFQNIEVYTFNCVMLKFKMDLIQNLSKLFILFT